MDPAVLRAFTELQAMCSASATACFSASVEVLEGSQGAVLMIGSGRLDEDMVEDDDVV